MKLEELFNSSILDELYNEEKDDFEAYIIKKNTENREFYEDGRIQSEIIEMLEHYIKDEKVIDKLNEKFKEYEKFSLKEYEYWCSKYFKKGFINCIRLKNDLNNNLNDDEPKDTFFNYEFNCFSDYIDEHRIKNIRKMSEYKELNKQIKEITDKYPRAREFLEDEVIDKITDEEQQAIIDILVLQEQINLLEEKEIFKLGGKEMFCFLKQMDLLK